MVAGGDLPSRDSVDEIDNPNSSVLASLLLFASAIAISAALSKKEISAGLYVLRIT